VTCASSHGLYVVYILHIPTVASLWVAPHSPLSTAGESSHELLDPPRCLGRLGLATLLLCIVGLWRHSVQYTLPAALATALEQPSCWHRLPPPCALQKPVSPLANLVQPSCWQRLPPPCVMQCSVSP
jgi:hypothetical protein